jgi:hypothetical protein
MIIALFTMIAFLGMLPASNVLVLSRVSEMSNNKLFFH